MKPTLINISSDSNEQNFLNVAAIIRIESNGNDSWTLYWNEGDIVQSHTTENKLDFNINTLFDIVK